VDTKCNILYITLCFTILLIYKTFTVDMQVFGVHVNLTPGYYLQFIGLYHAKS
jgi:hypothetical protein